MTQTVDPTMSLDVSSETLDLSTVNVSAEARSENAPQNVPSMEQKKTRADSHQSPHSHFSESAEKGNVLPVRAFRPALETISSESKFLALAVDVTEKIETTTYKDDIEVQKSGSFRSERSGVLPSRLQRFCVHWLTTYRVLIATTFIINAVVLGLLIGLALPITNILIATAANLLASVLVRQEDLINLHFGLIARIPSTTPLGLRKVIADFHHYGGVHVGCAVSALLWYGVYIYANTRACIMALREGWMTNLLWADIVTCYVFLLFITSMCLTAIPRIRERLHNQFERIHRFGGWMSLAVLWVNAGIRTIIDPEHTPLYKSKSIWLLAIVTFLIILPWLRMRKVSICAQVISSREVKLTFPYANMPYTSTMRFSLSPLMEWHAFATIPAPDGFTADIIISAAGDWTKRIIANPPTKMCIRNPPTTNFLAVAAIFDSLLLVATGAGIGPMLSLLSSPTLVLMKQQGKKIKVMWCVFDPFAPHWSFVQSLIRAIDPDPSIFDSRKGRPDISFEARHLAQKESLEAVMVVSNKKVTNQIVGEVKSLGGAAYGAVFDS
jgi:hypothetical protein